jgi:retron-type reverse transcriptase
VSWIIDADIQGFFDAVSQEWLVRFLEHRVGDPERRCTSRRNPSLNVGGGFCQRRSTSLVEVSESSN